MKILVTGGAGFIGSGLVPHLAGLGHHVVVLDNLSVAQGRRTSRPSSNFIVAISLMARH